MIGPAVLLPCNVKSLCNQTFQSKNRLYGILIEEYWGQLSNPSEIHYTIVRAIKSAHRCSPNTGSWTIKSCKRSTGRNENGEINHRRLIKGDWSLCIWPVMGSGLIQWWRRSKGIGLVWEIGLMWWCTITERSSLSHYHLHVGGFIFLPMLKWHFLLVLETSGSV